MSPITTDRKGLALASSLFAIIVVGVLISAVFIMTQLQSSTSQGKEDWVRANQFAEAGQAHGLSVLRTNLRDTTNTRLLRGSDNAAATTDDGRLTGYALAAALQIPVAGKNLGTGLYKVHFLDDPADTDGLPLVDSNLRIVMRCTGETADGSVAEIDVVVGFTPSSGIVVDGPLTVSGNPTLTGMCGTAHANGNLGVSGVPTARTALTSSATATGSASDSLGTVLPSLSNQPTLDVPNVNPMDYCTPGATHILQSNGFILEVATGILHDARSTEKFGWKRSSSSPVIWDGAGNSVSAGTFCAQGNVKLSGNTGSDASPLSLSLIASGSIEISGNPVIKPNHPEGISLMAAGDLSISGNPGTNPNFSGLLYGGSQCKVAGNPGITGQLLCDNKANPAGSVDYAAINEISGNPKITYECGGNLFNKRRIFSWYSRIGT